MDYRLYTVTCVNVNTILYHSLYNIHYVGTCVICIFIYIYIYIIYIYIYTCVCIYVCIYIYI